VDPRHGTVEWVRRSKAAPFPRQMYTRSAAVGLWDREQRAGVIQAPRQIRRAHFSCPGRHRNLVTQGLMRPALIIEEEPLADL
jgi:hypothetical protein